MYMRSLVTQDPRRKYPQQSKVTLEITGCHSHEPTWAGSFGTSIILSLLLCRLLLNLNYNNDVKTSNCSLEIPCYCSWEKKTYDPRKWNACYLEN